MTLFKCKMCGGSLEINENVTVATCEYCGSQQTLPRLDDDRRANLYDRANHFRRNNEYDKAMGIYERILNEDNTDAEAYWSLVLCRYGIEYVEDPASYKRIPTVNRAQYTSVFDDDNYKLALQYADAFQRNIYEEEAKAINEIQKGILAISQKEEPFDVFICYKETDNNGRRTQDSVLANDLYHQLTQEGFKVFFSRITLEDKLGSAYEPYIFAALNSAKVMVVLGTKPEYFRAVWVRNEWSRYLALIKQGQKKMLIPAYKDMDPYDLPEEFSHLQAQDMSKLGFMQDLIRGIKKIVEIDTPKTTVVKETVIADGSANIAPLLKRAFMFLEDGDWNSANEYCEKVLDINPECAEAYLGKLMAELHVNKQEELKNQAECFDSKNNYSKVIRFAEEELKATLNSYIEHIKIRNENTRIAGIYNRAKQLMTSKSNESKWLEAAKLFETIENYKDSVILKQECYEKAEEARIEAENARKDSILKKGHAKMHDTIANYEAAIELFKSIPGWKDADECLYACKKKIEEIKEKEEEDRLERERREAAEAAEVERALAEKVRIGKRNKRLAIITGATIVFIIVLQTVIIPISKYNKAIGLFDVGKYNEAIEAFEALNGYKDSEERIIECRYSDAVGLLDAGKYGEAIEAFEALDGYKDSEERIIECKYGKAIELQESSKYMQAVGAFSLLNGYKDSEERITECKYNNALKLLNEGDILEAYESLIGLDGYKDSMEKAESIYQEYVIEQCNVANVGDSVFFGFYEQDNDFQNGKESVEWLVLEKKDEKVLVISKKGLIYQPYHSGGGDVTWESSTLRQWLNTDFLKDTFSGQEQKMISMTTVSADKNPEYDTNPGKETQDQLFLLSVTEATKYFNSDSIRQCTGTEYAEALLDRYREKCHWWLRTPGKYQDCAVVVYHHEDGLYTIGDRVYADRSYAIRPAMWIDLKQ